MKRIGIIAILVLLTAGVAIAQESQNFASNSVKQKGGFSGYIYSKVQLNFLDQDGDASWGPNWWSSGYNYGGNDFAFGLDLVGENKGLHAEGAFSNTEFFMNNITSGTDPANPSNTYGTRISAFYYWADLVPEELRFKLGYVSDSFYKKERTDHTGVGAFSGWGAYANYTPKWSKDVLQGAFSIGAFYPVAFGKNKTDMTNWSLGNTYDFYPAADSLKELGLGASYILADTVKLYVGTIGGGSVTYSGSADETSALYTSEGAVKVTSTHFKRKYFGSVELLTPGFSNTFAQVAYTAPTSDTAEDGWYQSLLYANYTLEDWKCTLSILDKFYPQNASKTADYQEWEVMATPSLTKILDTFDASTELILSGVTNSHTVDSDGNSYLTYKVTPSFTFPDLSYLTAGFQYTGYTSARLTDTWNLFVSLDIWLGF